MRTRPPQHRPFEAGSLPEDQKEELCRSLLAEFGVTKIQKTHKGELIHGCVIGDHSNQDREPTASLNYQKLTFNCLGCGASGGLLWFIATCRGEGTEEARTWLAKTAGLDGQVMELDNLLKYLDSLYHPANVASAPIPRYSPKTLEPWAFIHPYMTEIRGVPEETLERFRVGYAEEYFCGKDPAGRPILSERIIFPHFWKGNLVGWQSRRLANDGTPKYLNSPDFPKDTTIYNYDPKQDVAVVVESGPSVLRHVHALHMESTFGAKVTDLQASLLAKHPTVVVWMDNDEAGWTAVDHLWELLGPSVNMLVVDSPFAADPGDMTTEDVLDLVAGAIPYPVWTRPTELYCYECERLAHEGRCA